MKKWTKEDCYFNIPSQREIPKVMKKNKYNRRERL
jgi:hypothetical protein